MKKVISILLVCAMIFTLCACGKEKSTGEKVETFEYVKTVKMGKPEVKLDPIAALKALKVVPQIFYGRHLSEGYLNTLAIKEGVKFEHPEKGEIKISSLPTGFIAGPTSIVENISFCKDYNIMKVRYDSSEGNLDMFAAYELAGNKITLTIVESYTFDDYKMEADVKLTDKKFTYTYTLEGDTIIFSDGQNSMAYANASVGAQTLIIEGYLDDDTPDTPDDSMYSFLMSNLHGTVIGNKKIAESKLRVLRADYEQASATYSTDGILTLTRENPETGETYTKQYLMFICGLDGFVLCDGVKTYCYTKGYNEIAAEELGHNLDPVQIEALKSMNGYDLSDIIEKRNKLFKELEQELAKQGVKATVNKQNGEIALDSAILFATGEATLSEPGKAFLQKFVSCYTAVVLKDEYADFFSKVMVEGHTDSTGTIEVNKPLSQSRADTVLQYCISADSGLSATEIAAIKTLLAAAGYASERLVLNADGTENTDASRRVGFRFIIDLNPAAIETTVE